MPSPLAFLAGLGQAGVGLGTDLETQAALREAQQARRAQDALARLSTMVKLGATPVTPGTDPQDALNALTQRNTNQSVLQNAPGAGAFSGGTDYSQFGSPQLATLPTAAGGQDSFVLDPSRTPEALSELRAGRAEDARYHQEMDVEHQRTMAAAALKTQEAADAQKKADTINRSYFGAYMHEFPNADPKATYDPNINYLEEVKNQRAKQQQGSVNAIERMKIDAMRPKMIWAHDPNSNQDLYVTEQEAAARGMTKPQGGFGGQGALSPQALAAMSAQAKEADDIMTKYEAKYGKNPSLVGPGSGLLASAQSTQGQGLYAGGQRLLGNMGLGAANPEYQQYLAAQKRFGNIMGNLMSRRYTEHQGTLDTELAGLQAGDVMPTITLKQSYRKDLLDHFPVQGAGGGPTGASNNDLEAYIANRGGKKKP
jgi:hypothetical protein